MSTIQTDVLIIGGGMSGLSAAVTAANAGVDALVIEKSNRVGGSAQYSAGMFWAPRNYQIARETIPEGEPALQEKFISQHLAAVQFMRDQGIRVSEQFNGIMTIGVGFPIEIRDWLKKAQDIIESSKNVDILFNSTVVELFSDGPGRPVTGAVIRASDNSFIQVHAKSVIIATGGFQGNPRLVNKHIGLNADNIFVRSNPYSVGDGYNLAVKVGAGLSRGLSTFYGHLLPSPLAKRDVDPMDFLKLAQFQSGHSIIVDCHGKRFCDETFGDEVTNQRVARLPDQRAYMICNQQIKEKYAVGEAFPNSGDVDRLELARSVGGRVYCSQTVKELVEVLTKWGLPAAVLKDTIKKYNDAIGSPSGENVSYEPTIGGNGSPHPKLVDGTGPFWVVEVQPTITFSYGGIKIDTGAHALTPDGVPIKNLYACGVDAGGFSNFRYCGGLALAHITGAWAMKSAVADQVRNARARI